MKLDDFTMTPAMAAAAAAHARYLRSNLRGAADTRARRRAAAKFDALTRYERMRLGQVATSLSWWARRL